MGEVVSGSTKFCAFSSCPEAEVLCSNKVAWNTTSEFINFFCKLLIGFYQVKLWAMLKCIIVSLMWFHVKAMHSLWSGGNKMANVEKLFLGFFQLLHLNNGV